VGKRQPAFAKATAGKRQSGGRPPQPKNGKAAAGRLGVRCPGTALTAVQTAKRRQAAAGHKRQSGGKPPQAINGKA